MSKSVSFVSATILIVLFFYSAPSAMSQTCMENAYGQRVCTGGGGIAYHYNADERAFYRVPARMTDTRAAEGDGPAWEVLYVTWACGFNQPENPGDVLCNDSYCTTSTGERGVWRVVYRRLEGSGDPWTPWPGSNGMSQLRECLESTDPITLDQIRDELLAIIENRYRQISEPRIRIDPSGSALVNLPVLASTDDPGIQGFSITNPLPGAVEAAPTYAWTWSNGDTSSGPGRPYDGTSPTGNPDYYGVLSTYSRSGDGSVTLEVTWDVVLAVPGNPPVTDIAPLIYTADADFTVRSAGTVLVD
jgi:hypothetical protein